MASTGKTRQTGVVYDEQLASHFSAWNTNFTEQPARTATCIARCNELGLLERCKRIPVRESTLEEMIRCHSQKHIDILQKTETMHEEELKSLSQKYDYIYFHQESFKNAKLALGGVIDLVEEIVLGRITNGMAIVRPPGHHAMREEFCGYCYFGNVAIAAQLMLDRHNLKRILIFDWDVHHGQGSQFMFYDDPRVLFVSIHRYEHGSEWPYLRESDYDFFGEGPGRGFTINIPLNETDCKNDDYLPIFFNLLLPIVYEFDPELVLVSAGYDCALGCPEGEMSVTPACFAHFVNLLTPLAGGKLALVLEGGYNLKSLSESCMLSLRALLGDPTPKIGPISSPKASVVASVLNVIKMVHGQWKSLRYQDLSDMDNLAVEKYPFEQVLDLPPVKGVDFYTSDTRPSHFPLIQDCFDEKPSHELDEINSWIDDLIRETSLEKASRRLSIVYKKNDASVCELKDCLTETDQWSSCLIIEDPPPMDGNPEGCVRAGLDSILSEEVQSSIVFVSTPDIKDSSALANSLSSSRKILSSAIQHIEETGNVQRVLVVDLNDLQPLPVAANTRVLCISLECKCDFCENGERETSNGEHVQRVRIPFQEHKVTDADLISAVHHVLLPIAYEFAPDIVVLRLNSSQKDDHTLTVSPALTGHLSQMLAGLAQGRVLVLVQTAAKHQAHPSTSLIQCASVLLGDPCLSLAPGSPSEKTFDAMKQLLDELKHKWTLLQFRHSIPRLQYSVDGEMSLT